MIWPFARNPRRAPERIEPSLGATPTTKARRVPARAYAGAAAGRLLNDWAAPQSSGDSEIFGSLRLLRSRARQIIRDYDFVRGGIRSLVNNVIGRDGVRLQMQVPMLRGGGKLATSVNDSIETEFWAWGRVGNCDVTGKLSWSALQRLIFWQIVEAGEVLVRRINTRAFGSSKYPFALELIEADLLAEDHNVALDNGRQIRMGVELDEWGRPVAYWLHPRHPGDYQFAAKARTVDRLRRIPAEEIRHIFIADRIGQTRGVPWLAATMTRVRQTQGFEEAEVIAARVQACSMGFIESPAGDYPADDETGDAGDGLPTMNLEPGVMERLAPGEKVSFNNPTRPAGNYDPFVRAQLRGMAAGLGVTYEDLSGDYSQSNYSSSRMALMNSRDHYRTMQGWIVEQLHEWIFPAWLAEAVAWGAINLADYRNNAARYERAAVWRPRGWDWIDPRVDCDTAIKSIRAGITTLRDVVESKGGDIEETLRARKTEQEMIADLGLSLDSDPDKFTIQGQAQQAGAAESDQDQAAASGDQSTEDSEDGTENDQALDAAANG